MYSIKRRIKLAALAAIISVTLLPVTGPAAPANAAPTGPKTFGVFTYVDPFPGYAMITGCVNETCPANLRIPSLIRGKRVTDILPWAFANQNIESVTIANGIWSIGSYAFINNQLQKLTLPPSIRMIASSAFENNYLLSRVSFSNGIRFIDQRAFYDNNLTSVVFPGSLWELGEDAFADNQLTSVRFKGDAPSGFGTDNPNVFANNPGLTEIGVSPDTQGWDDLGYNFSGLPVRERIFVNAFYGAPTIIATSSPLSAFSLITVRNPSNMPNVTSWRVSTDNGATWIKPASTVNNFNSSELLISGLTVGTRYKIKVVAITNSGGFLDSGKEVSRISSTVNFTPTLPN